MAIQIRRGNAADLVPANLSQGEPFVCLDTKAAGVKGNEELIYLATGDSSGNAANALKLGGIPASGFPQISSGTWTPTLRGDDVAGSPTYVTQHGVYIRISNLVHVFFNLELSAKGGMQGLVRVSGLPYAAAEKSATSDINGAHGADGTVPFGCYVAGTEIAVNSTADQLSDNYAVWAGHAVYIAV